MTAEKHIVLRLQIKVFIVLTHLIVAHTLTNIHQKLIDFRLQIFYSVFLHNTYLSFKQVESLLITA